VFVFAIEQFTVLVEQNAAEESLLWAAYNTRSFMSQAVDLEVHASPVSTSITFPAKGQILDSFTSASDGAIQTVAAFGREMSSAAGASSSTIFSTGIFFVNPSSTPVGSNAQPWGGVLIFDMGSAGGAGGAMWPTLGDLWFDRISEFKIQDVECAIPGATGAGCIGSNAKSATVIIKARYFKNAKRDQWIYGTAGAATVAPYRDIEMTIKVGFRDNVLLNSAGSRVGSTTDERLHGGLYFFRMMLPPLKM
jgi:hypothetical protein